jgi:hypothetical protein
MQVTVMQLGQAFFVGVPGEPYQVLQRAVRERCAGLSVVLATFCNQSTELGYLLPADKVGQGTYQDELMFVQAGALELMIERISDKVLGWAQEFGLGQAAAAAAAAVEEMAELSMARL